MGTVAISGLVKIRVFTFMLLEVSSSGISQSGKGVRASSSVSIRNEMASYPAFKARSMTLGLSAIKIPFSGSCLLKRSFSDNLA